MSQNKLLAIIPLIWIPALFVDANYTGLIVGSCAIAFIAIGR